MFSPEKINKQKEIDNGNPNLELAKGEAREIARTDDILNEQIDALMTEEETTIINDIDLKSVKPRAEIDIERKEVSSPDAETVWTVDRLKTHLTVQENETGEQFLQNSIENVDALLGNLIFLDGEAPNRTLVWNGITFARERPDGILEVDMKQLPNDFARKGKRIAKGITITSLANPLPPDPIRYPGGNEELVEKRQADLAKGIVEKHKLLDSFVTFDTHIVKQGDEWHQRIGGDLRETQGYYIDVEGVPTQESFRTVTHTPYSGLIDRSELSYRSKQGALELRQIREFYDHKGGRSILEENQEASTNIFAKTVYEEGIAKMMDMRDAGTLPTSASVFIPSYGTVNLTIETEGKNNNRIKISSKETGSSFQYVLSDDFGGNGKFAGRIEPDGGYTGFYARGELFTGNPDTIISSKNLFHIILGITKQSQQVEKGNVAGLGERKTETKNRDGGVGSYTAGIGSNVGL